MSKLTLDRILQSQGFGSRKYCRSLIEDGEVAINGEVVGSSTTIVSHPIPKDWRSRCSTKNGSIANTSTLP